MSCIPKSSACLIFDSRPAFPGTITAAHPAFATSLPISFIFSSWRERMRSARKSAAAMRAGSWESMASGLSRSASWEKTARTSSGHASNPNPRSTISAPLSKKSLTFCLISGVRWASIISARTFILVFPPIFTPRIQKAGSPSTSLAAIFLYASFFRSPERNSSAGTSLDNGILPMSGRTILKSAACRGPRYTGIPVSSSTL